MLACQAALRAPQRPLTAAQMARVRLDVPVTRCVRAGHAEVDADGALSAGKSCLGNLDGEARAPSPRSDALTVAMRKPSWPCPSASIAAIVAV